MRCCLNSVSGQRRWQPRRTGKRPCLRASVGEKLTAYLRRDDQNRQAWPAAFMITNRAVSAMGFTAWLLGE
jgi:hypothetical protein